MEQQSKKWRVKGSGGVFNDILRYHLIHRLAALEPASASWGLGLKACIITAQLAANTKLIMYILNCVKENI